MTESDHKKAYQEYLKEKTFRTVVIYFAITIFFYQICGHYIRCYVLPVISDAWVHAYINVQHYLYTNQAGGSPGQKERALQAKAYTRFQF